MRIPWPFDLRSAMLMAIARKRSTGIAPWWLPATTHTRLRLRRSRPGGRALAGAEVSQAGRLDGRVLHAQRQQPPQEHQTNRAPPLAEQRKAELANEPRRYEEDGGQAGHHPAGSGTAA